MNTTAQALVFAVASVAAAAAVGMSLADSTAQPRAVVKLERVVIVGKRADVQAPMWVVQLPRVVIEGRRTVPSDVQVADAKPVTQAL